MAMLHKRDKPSYYDIVNEDGHVFDTVPKSKVLKRLKELEQVFKIKLQMKLKGDNVQS
jgi:hypothetical protein